jgi:hypothetical protein
LRSCCIDLEHRRIDLEQRADEHDPVVRDLLHAQRSDPRPEIASRRIQAERIVELNPEVELVRRLARRVERSL